MMKKSVLFLTTALVLLVVFSGCGEGTTEPPSISITVTGIDYDDLPAYNTMAGFTVSLFKATANLDIDWNVGPLEQRTVLKGTTAEAVLPYLPGSNPPKSNSFSLTFKVLLTSQFTGNGNYVVVLGASDGYDKYTPGTNPPIDNQLYSNGQMFITGSGTSSSSNAEEISINDGVSILWSKFYKKAAAAHNRGYPATTITTMFP